MRLKFRELANIIYFLTLVLITFNLAKSIFNENYEIKKKHSEKILKWKLIIISNNEDWRTVQVNM
jgi:hypothetical protein